ncbi:cytochrome P450 [Heliocybe sulcata]|uniref:Cytochrome P450 n=1 Tax=Heliocybe sulcata TaxID=5364 RepID=A0A5C3NHA0_9AGAM|nr:cytochrome P450 [Heliocybe sulcata]
MEAAQVNWIYARPVLFSIAIGILSHHLLFIRGEWDRYVARLFHASICVPGLIYIVLLVLSSQPALGCLNTTFILNSGYYVGLFSSMLAYRAFFHRLRTFPGPFGARLTSFWSLQKQAPDMKWYKHVQSLHAEYGDFVRIRPRELSIAHPDAVQAIHSYNSPCSKGPYYDLYYPRTSLQLLRDKAAHSRRRKMWDRGLGDRALRDYEPRVLNHCFELLHLLKSRSSLAQVVDLTPYLSNWGFDVIGDLAVGQQFNMLKSGGTAQHVLANMSDAKFFQVLLVTAPWLFTLLARTVPYAKRKRERWIQWCQAIFLERKEHKSGSSDMFSHLVDADSQKSTGPQLDFGSLVYDTELAIFAGSETSSGALGGAVFLLATHPNILTELYEELHDVDLQMLSQKSLVRRPMLDGVINEALRLFPPVPSGLCRLTPPEGAVIAGQWIPGDVIVSTPTYTLARDTRCFSKPDDFLPERWSSRPDLILRKDAFVPFSAGTYSCAGKQLAMLELRLMLALLVKTFDIRMGGEEAVKLFSECPGPRDAFTMDMPPLRVLLSPR